MFKDYYLIMGIGKDATPEEIEKAFEDACTKLNDKSSSAIFQDMQEAFSVLSNQETKSLYDNELASFNWSEGFSDYMIKDQKLANIIDSMQGKRSESKKTDSDNRIIIEDKDQVDCMKPADENAKEINQTNSAPQSTFENRTTKLPINNSKGMFRRVLTPRGRIRRTEFFISLLLYLFIYFILYFMIRIAYETSFTALIYLKIIDAIFFILFVFQCIKRCHDWGHSGWFILIPFMPIFLLFVEGDDEVNKYGTNPKIDYYLQV